MKSYSFSQWLVSRVLPVISVVSLNLASPNVTAQTPTLQPDYSVYYPGEEISIHFQGGPGNGADWLGIYPEGGVPGSGTSTLWAYVNDTQTAGAGLSQGTVTFTGGLSDVGTWYVYFLLNDSYTPLATNSFTVIDPSAPRVRPNQLAYTTGQDIQINFTNGPGNAKDWVGIYLQGQTPGGPLSTVWYYVDGTQAGDTGLNAGTITFAGGLTTSGNYVVYLLENDGYGILASHAFTVAQASANQPQITSLEPADGAKDLPPKVSFLYTILNGASKVVSNSVALTIDGNPVAATYAQQDSFISIGYTNANLFAPASSHTATLVFDDDATPAQRYTNETTFEIAAYRNLVLPQPLYFENFDSTTEGELPSGWTQISYTEAQNPDVDFGNLDSAAYAQWTVVNVDRFKGSFVTYSDPTRAISEQTNYQRVLTPNLLNVVNGQVLTGPLASGRFLFADSGYRYGASQVLFAFSPDYNLAGKTNIYVSYHSLWEQNQDAIGAVEYSIDQGGHWLPVVYMLDQWDVLTVTNETTGEITVDAVATFTAEYDDAPVYTDENGETKGGTYGAFIGAEVSQDLAPYLSPRVDDDPKNSKRVEYFRLPAADNQAKVRFRFAYAGTDSWYFGVDDFGLYSISATPVERPSLTLTKTNGGWLISWPDTYTGYKLESASALPSASWTEVTGVVNNSITVNPTGTAFYRLRQ